VDIGIGDYTSIWFVQRLRPKIRLVAYYQNCGEGLPFYLTELERLRAKHGWTYGDHFWPHDGRVRDWGSGVSRIEQFRQRTGVLPRLLPRMEIDHGINAVRLVLGLCEFNEGPCAEGLKALRGYRREWDEERGIWRDKPRHDSASHGADAFRCLATRYRGGAAAQAEAGGRCNFARQSRRPDRLLGGLLDFRLGREATSRSSARGRRSCI
jgi:hypothetical protein